MYGPMLLIPHQTWHIHQASEAGDGGRGEGAEKLENYFIMRACLSPKGRNERDKCSAGLLWNGNCWIKKAFNQN